MCGRRSETSEGGFTLVELMVVVGMAAILLSILTLGIRRAVESFALRQAGAMAAVEIRNAQAGAIGNGVDHMVEFDTSSGAAGPPGSLLVYRPGVQAGGAINVISTGSSDTRSVTVVGIDNGVLTSDTFILDGTTAKTCSTTRTWVGGVCQANSVTYQWILEAETPTPNSCCTVSIRQGTTVLATIAPSASTSTNIPWTQIRRIIPPEWPAQVRIEASGTTLPLCSTYGAPWSASTNHCLRFLTMGTPDQGDTVVLLCNRARTPLRLVISAGTGRVGIDRTGACP